MNSNFRLVEQDDESVLTMARINREFAEILLEDLDREIANRTFWQKLNSSTLEDKFQRTRLRQAIEENRSIELALRGGNCYIRIEDGQQKGFWQ